MHAFDVHLDAGTRYRYTNVAREGKGWPSFLIDLKAMVELRAQQHFNFVFCNLYANEHDYIGWYAPSTTLEMVSNALA